MIIGDRNKWWVIDGTPLKCQGTSRVKAARCRDMKWIGDVPAQRGWDGSGPRLQSRHGQKQRDCVRVSGIVDDVIRRAFLDDSAQVHDRNPVRTRSSRGQIVCDHENGKAATAKTAEKIEDSRP
jgi:hypothetical protein